MDFNKLETFLVVAELGSMTAAGRRLQRSQSAISQQIQALENELGLRLLERKAGKILLSADGETLREIAKVRIGQIREGVQELRREKKTVEGHVRIGVLDDYANEFEVGVPVAKLCAEHPKISVSVTYGTSASLEADLIENRIDLACLVFFTKSELFVRQEIRATKHNLYTSAAYLKRRGPLRAYAEILEAELLDLHDDFTTLVPWFRKNSPQLLSTLKHRKPNAVAASHKTLKQIVVAGFGVAILPDYLLEKEIKNGSCVRVLPSAKSITSGLDLAYRTNKTLRLCEKSLVDRIRSS